MHLYYCALKFYIETTHESYACVHYRNSQFLDMEMLLVIPDNAHHYMSNNFCKRYFTDDILDHFYNYNNPKKSCVLETLGQKKCGKSVHQMYYNLFKKMVWI